VAESFFLELIAFNLEDFPPVRAFNVSEIPAIRIDPSAFFAPSCRNSELFALT
jgi:hypothetical protein